MCLFNGSRMMGDYHVRFCEKLVEEVIQVYLPGLHLLNAWSVENSICLGHIDVDIKSNEITAIPKLIEILDLKGCIITTDALNTQKTTTVAVINTKADYVLPVKGNHKELLEDIELLFEDATSQDYRGFDADQFETQR